MTLSELKKEYPIKDYLHIESKKPLTEFGKFEAFGFQIWIGSPSHKGDKQPLFYYRVKQ